VLGRRIATALILAPLIFGVLFFLPIHYAEGFFFAMYLMGAWEWALFMALLALLGAANYSLWILMLAVPTWLLGLSWILRFPLSIPRWQCAVFGLVSISLAWFAVAALLGLPGGPQWVLFAFLIVWLADTGAYFVGRTLGRHKLAPSVSPGKTWEGVAGGMLASGLVGYAGSVWFDLAPGLMIPLVLVCGSVSVIGDLTVSVFKREAGLKDSGWILPGHGGILDRMDSLTAAAPILALGLQTAGLVG
jgi:phosphatidate cytidylyltransferase